MTVGLDVTVTTVTTVGGGIVAVSAIGDGLVTTVVGLAPGADAGNDAGSCNSC